MRLAAFEPDQAGNVGAMIRICACFGAALDVIEPCGFPFSIKPLRRAAMDYADITQITRHNSWDAFLHARPKGRLILLTTEGAQDYRKVSYQADDTFIVGRESAGAPPHVHDAADIRAVIPVRPPARSLNVSVAAAVALSEAVRQTAFCSANPKNPPD